MFAKKVEGDLKFGIRVVVSNWLFLRYWNTFKTFWDKLKFLISWFAKPFFNSEQKKFETLFLILENKSGGWRESLQTKLLLSYHVNSFLSSASSYTRKSLKNLNSIECSTFLLSFVFWNLNFILLNSTVQLGNKTKF